MPERTLLGTTDHGWHWVGSTWGKLIAAAGVSGLALAGLTFWYASRVEPLWFDFSTRRIPIKNLPRAFQGYRIVQLADMHLGRNKPLTPDRLSGLIERVNASHPDLVVYTGDYVTKLDEVGQEGIARLANLRVPDGTYSILGNHDYWSGKAAVVREAEQAGFQMLLNKHVVIRRGSASLVLAGLDDIWDGQPDLDQALRGSPAGAPVVMLVHEPNYAEIVAQTGRVDLQLSGHSHGGQARVPGLGPLALPDQSWRFPMGQYRVGNMWLYVSRGMGLSDIPVRFNCRPEITTFILERA